MKAATTIAILAGLASASAASVTVTESFAGLSGEDGTVDWIEVTNTGASSIDTATLWYDDSNPSMSNAGQLDSIILASGESAIFLISDDNEASDDLTYGSAVAEFQAIWNYSGLIGLTNGGGGLGQSDDQVNLLDMSGTILFSVDSPSALAGNLETTDYVNGAAASALGVNGAYASMTFFNDNLGLPNNEATLIGSPGVVPTPASMAVIALGGLVAGRRRR